MEAGIGKSRLVEVLRERVIGQGATRMVFRCSPYHHRVPLSGDRARAAGLALASRRGSRGEDRGTGAWC